MDIEIAIGLITAVGIPTVIWGYNMHRMTKKLLEMHENPDNFKFGTSVTNKLVLESRTMVLNATNEQTRYLKDLVHYTRIMCRLANNGKEVTPREPSIDK